MSQSYGSPNPDPSPASNNSMVAFSADRQGVLNVQDRVKMAAIAGKLFVANWGALTTPLAIGATTAITALRPSAWLNVPADKVVYIVRNVITVEANGATTQGEIRLATISTSAGDGTSTAAAVNQNANPGRIGDTPGTGARALATADIAAETDLAEVDRYSFAASAVDQKFEYNANKEGLLVPLRGPCSFLMYLGGNAASFYMQTHYIEEDEELAV